MPRIPIATYRFQMHGGFPFAEAEKVVPYLAQLGISDVYSSPVFRARAGSTHGYDVLDPNSMNPETGGDEGFKAFTTAVKQQGLGLLQDIVPNHMALDGQNRMLMDVLENCSDSRYYRFFDVEWDYPYESLRNRLLAPILGSRYGEALENGEIKLVYDENGFGATYYQQRFPLSIQSYVDILTLYQARLRRALGREHSDYIKFLGVLYTLKNLSAAGDQNERYDQIMFAKRMLHELYDTSEPVRTFVNENVAIYNGEQGEENDRFRLLDTLLNQQHFKLAYWKVATQELNYRRFFTINDLISLRMDDEEVMRETHATILRLVKESVFTGLRIDHIDGLSDPWLYLQRLREAAGDIYITVEKILVPGEDLPADWPVQGTTGYDFLNDVNSLFCDRRNEDVMNAFYERFTGLTTPYKELVSQKKRIIIGRHMAGDIDNLAHYIKKISSKFRHSSDITLYGLRRGLVEIMAFFPIYRTYVRPGVFTESDRAVIARAINAARRTTLDIQGELNFIEQFLTLRFPEVLPEEERKEWVRFVMRFQQFTGPLMAKGFEDTTLYVYNRLVSLNEVGSDPSRFGISTNEFHAINKKRSERWPNTMNATATHDTKRGEDTRARINVLSEIPREWQKAVSRWSKLNRAKKTDTVDGVAPDANDEYMFYQTLIGTYPFGSFDAATYCGRIRDYMIKAVREAKVHTAWLKNDKEYEDALNAFVNGVLDSGPENAFLGEFLPLQRRVARYGVFNALSQTLLKLTAPGVPDFYQGTELWDFSLVDPDNRRPVDYGERQRVLSRLRSREGDTPGLLRELLEKPEDGALKMYVVYRTLGIRRALSDAFTSGAYIPLPVKGEGRQHIIAFARVAGSQCAVVIAPRLLASLIGEDMLPLGEQVWKGTRITVPAGWDRLTDAFTQQVMPSGTTLRIADALHDFPLALLVGQR